MPANSCLVTDLQFAMTCLNNASGGVTDFQAVAQQCGMPTAAAAGMKLWRMKKAHSLSLNGNTTGNPSTTSASPTPGVKRQGAGKKICNKRKHAALANEDDSEDVESPKKCKIDDVVKKENQEDE
ncbi:hypothetical protein KC318_g3965 [Hortaea werneckii]|uniref:Myb-like DNA-binding domain-containing protein n=1 Tax=Hortaea werneckii TaxID=91943 RepID=A0A3M6YHC1_HORWE|nr:hypothetical protein KC334_g3913 [Hortaea werneckii]KAI7016822.1 hypothetical protein KC355_g3861 [Hortaea werneckii]KAI7670560.1 hypothetical protein KC318_g3965 [Hortaea werneckii]RMY02466.1 hypothetical protein D0867_11041 [Hortaea werneckii]